MQHTEHVTASGGQGRSEAERVLATVRLSLPASATDVTVDSTPLPPFTDAALVTFTADVTEVGDLCTQAGGTLTPGGVLGPQDRTILRGHDMPSGGSLCEVDLGYGRGPNLRMVMPGSGTGEVVAAVYSVPNR